MIKLETMTPDVCKRLGGKWNASKTSCRLVSIYRVPGRNKLWQVQEGIVADGDNIDDPYSVPHSYVVVGKNNAVKLKNAWLSGKYSKKFG